MGASDSKECKTYYRDDTICEIYHTKKGKRHGPCTKYHPNGKIQTICNYDSGLYDGDYVEYHYNGNLYIETKSKQGLYYDHIKNYDNDGKLILHIKVDELSEFPCDGLWMRSNYICRDVDHKKSHYVKFSYVIRRTHKYIIIYDVYDGSVYINLNIINPIRTIQKRFRKKRFDELMNKLNYIFLNNISYIISSYLLKN